MNLKTFIIVFLLWAPRFMIAQIDTDLDMPDKTLGRERIKTLKIAYITEKVNISSEEGQKFFPIYNEYTTKLEANRAKYIQAKTELNTASNLNDETAANKALSNIFVCRKEETALTEQYYEKFKTVLSKIKVAKLMQAEINFQRILIQRLIEARQNKLNNK